MVVTSPPRPFQIIWKLNPSRTFPMGGGGGRDLKGILASFGKF